MTRATPLSDVIHHLTARPPPLIGFSGSRDYWERRFRLGGHSEADSRSENASYKAEVLHGLFQHHGVSSMIEFGCDCYQIGTIHVERQPAIDASTPILKQYRATYSRRSSQALPA